MGLLSGASGDRLCQEILDRIDQTWAEAKKKTAYRAASRTRIWMLQEDAEATRLWSFQCLHATNYGLGNLLLSIDTLYDFYEGYRNNLGEERGNTIKHPFGNGSVAPNHRESGHSWLWSVTRARYFQLASRKKAGKRRDCMCA